MHVAFVASEAVPFAKTGGLGDVIGALPRAIEREGHAACVFLPAFRSALASGATISATGISVQVPIGTQKVDAAVLESALPGSGVKVYLIDQPRYFDRAGLYGSDGKDYDDNCERFVFFNRAVLEAMGPLGIRPDVVHCNDWQTGLIPVYMKTLYQNEPRTRLRRFAADHSQPGVPGSVLAARHGAHGPGLAPLQLAPARIPRPDLLHEGRARFRRHAAAP